MEINSLGYSLWLHSTHTEITALNSMQSVVSFISSTCSNIPHVLKCNRLRLYVASQTRLRQNMKQKYEHLVH